MKQRTTVMTNSIHLVLLMLLFTPKNAFSSPISFAGGASFSWAKKSNYGPSAEYLLGTDLIGFTYFPMGMFDLRPGMRIGFSGYEQLEAPKSVKITEREISASAEAAITYDSFVVPSFATGGGILFRNIRLETTSDIQVDEDKISRWRYPLFLYVQAGIGFPIFFPNGKNLLIEPFLRREWIFENARQQIRFGFDFTYDFSATKGAG